MKEFISNKKNLTIAASVLVFLICLQLALKPTIEANRAHKQLTSQIATVSDFSFQPGVLNRKSKNLDLILKKYQGDSSALRGSMITKMSCIAESEKTKLSEVPIDLSSYHTDQYILQQLNFEGDFVPLTKTLNHLEFTDGIGVPRSISIRSGKRSGNEVGLSKTSMTVLVEIAK